MVVHKRRQTSNGGRQMASIFSAILLVLILFTACSSQFSTAEELQTYISKEKNGLTKSKKIGQVELKVTHRPTDLLVNQELGNKEYNETEVKKLREKYNQYAYFRLSLSANNKEIEAYNVAGQGDFGARVQQLSFGMDDMVQLHTNTQDTIDVADYIYQRTFGVGNSSDMLFAFEREQLKDSKWLQFQLDDIGLGTGINRFRFKTKDIENAPTIKFK